MTSPSKETVIPSPAATGQKRQAPRLDPQEYSLRKRLPARLPSRPNDIYVNNKTDFKAQLARCFKCLEVETCVYIHGLGAATTRAINLALQLQEKSSTPLDIAVNTSTVNLIGEILYILQIQRLFFWSCGKV